MASAIIIVECGNPAILRFGRLQNFFVMVTRLLHANTPLGSVVYGFVLVRVLTIN
jgi:hypothetical protein